MTSSCAESSSTAWSTRAGRSPMTPRSRWPGPWAPTIPPSTGWRSSPKPNRTALSSIASSGTSV
eukprot:10680471-Alexandrium_andersonii.AAC.1